MPSPQSSIASEESKGLLSDTSDEDYLTTAPKAKHTEVLLWRTVAALSTAIAITSLIFGMYQSPVVHKAVFPTDLLDARNTIEYERRIYTGALVYDPAEQRIVRLRDDEREYFGPPGEEIDAAWADLLHGGYHRD